jgi:hypothetical protein
MVIKTRRTRRKINIAHRGKKSKAHKLLVGKLLTEGTTWKTEAYMKGPNGTLL